MACVRRLSSEFIGIEVNQNQNNHRDDDGDDHRNVAHHGRHNCRNFRIHLRIRDIHLRNHHSMERLQRLRIERIKIIAMLAIRK